MMQLPSAHSALLASQLHQEATHLLAQRSKVVGIACGEQSACRVVDSFFLINDEACIIEVPANALNARNVGPAWENDSTIGITPRSTD